MKFYLIVAKGKRSGMPIPITVDLFLLGSARMCQLRSDSLGEKHCALVTRGKKVFIRDMDCGDPTLVNGHLLPPGDEWPLHAGDRISVGSLEFMIQYREKALSQKDLEEWAAKCLDVSSEIEAEQEYDDYRPLTTASNAAQVIIDRLQVMRGVVKGRLRIGLEDGVTSVRFNDPYLVEDAEIALIKKELCDNLSRPNLRVVLDLKNVRKMSTAAVIMILDFNRWLKPWGSRMVLCRIRPELREILSVLRVDNIPVFNDKRSAHVAQW
jgi:anti-anti-sigma regulatory factor